jgi:hypothetical protein
MSGIDERNFTIPFIPYEKNNGAERYRTQKGFWIWQRGNDTNTVPVIEKYYPIDYNSFYLKGNTIHAPSNYMGTVSSDFILNKEPTNVLKINDVDMLTTILDKTQITVYYDDNTKGRIILSDIFYHSKFWRNTIIALGVVLVIILYWVISRRVKKIKKEKRKKRLLAIKSYGGNNNGTFEESYNQISVSGISGSKGDDSYSMVH